jgi:hypothetical protein
MDEAALWRAVAVRGTATAGAATAATGAAALAPRLLRQLTTSKDDDAVDQVTNSSVRDTTATNGDGAVAATEPPTPELITT